MKNVFNAFQIFLSGFFFPDFSFRIFHSGFFIPDLISTFLIRISIPFSSGSVYLHT